MKILLFSTKDFNDGENMKEYVEKLKNEGFNVTQESYSPGGSTPYNVYKVEVNSAEELFKIPMIIKHSLIVNNSLEDDRPFIEVYDTYREPYSPKI